MESDNEEEKINGDENLGKCEADESVSGRKNVARKRRKNEKRKGRRRPRTKALRGRIREKIEVALCTSDSPIQNILERNENCQVSAPLSSVINALKLDGEEYQKLSYEALISIGNLSKLFSIVGDTRDTLRILLKNSGFEDSATVVYIDNLPRGCKVDTLERWASKFGTVVNVHPIVEEKAVINKCATKGQLLLSTPAQVSASLQRSTSAELSERFFQCAFIKFLDEHSPREFIKFHQLLRKNAAKRRRKKMRLLRIQGVKRSVKASDSSSRIKKKLRNKKHKPEEAKISSESQLQETGRLTSTTTMKTEVSAVEESTVRIYSSDDVARVEDGSHKRGRKRERELSYEEAQGVIVKKSKSTTSAVGAVKDSKRKVENDEEEMECVGEPTVVKNILKLTKMDIRRSSKKTFRDVGTDVPERILLKQDGVSKKRKRVHRQKRRNEKSKNRVLHPKKYFHDMQVYSLATFQKLRAKYLELQRQQMMQLKADLKKRAVSNALPGLSKKERKKKRGRSRLVLRALKLREEGKDPWHRIPEDEDRIANA